MNTFYTISSFLADLIDVHSSEVSGSRVAVVSAVASIIIFAIAL